MTRGAALPLAATQQVGLALKLRFTLPFTLPFTLLLTLLFTVLTGCASSPSPALGEPAWTTGRLSLRVQASAEKSAQTMSAAFELRGTGSSGELRLNSPLGTRVASARWSAGEAVLTTGEGEQRFADLEELSRRALGENLPLAALPDWLAGRPWAGAPHTPAATGFEQLGWQVELARRGEGWVEARRAMPPAVLVRVKIEDSP